MKLHPALLTFARLATASACMSVANDALNKYDLISNAPTSIVAIVARMTKAPDLMATLYLATTVLMLPLIIMMILQSLTVERRGILHPLVIASHGWWRDAMRVAVYASVGSAGLGILMVFASSAAELPVHWVFGREIARTIFLAIAMGWFLHATSGHTFAVQHLRLTWPIALWAMLVAPAAASTGATLAQGLGAIDPASLGAAAAAGALGGLLRSIIALSTDGKTWPGWRRSLLDLLLSILAAQLAFFVAEAAVEIGFAETLRQWPLTYGLALVAVGIAPTVALDYLGKLGNGIAGRLLDWANKRVPPT